LQSGWLKPWNLNAVLFACLTAWMAATHPWIAPGFAALAAGQILLIVGVRREIPARRAVAVLLAWLSLNYVGLVYTISLFAGDPQNARFWAAFAGALVLLSPVFLLAQRRLVPHR